MPRLRFGIGGYNGNGAEKPERLFICIYFVHSVNTVDECNHQADAGAGRMGGLLYDRHTQPFLSVSRRLHRQSHKEKRISLRRRIFGDFPADSHCAVYVGVYNGDRSGNQPAEIFGPDTLWKRRRNDRRKSESLNRFERISEFKRSDLKEFE